MWIACAEGSQWKAICATNGLHDAMQSVQIKKAYIISRRWSLFEVSPGPDNKDSEGPSNESQESTCLESLQSPHVSVIESFSGQAKQVRVTVGVASIQMALQVRASANESDDVPRGERSETSETSQSLKCWDHGEIPRHERDWQTDLQISNRRISIP